MEKKKEKSFSIPVAILTIGIITLWVSLITTYLAKGQEKGAGSYFGQFGDFVGGLMNPLLAFATTALLIYTIIQNQKMIRQNDKVIRDSRKELKLSRKELKRSRKIFQLELDNAELKTGFEIIKMITDEGNKLLDKPCIPVSNNEVISHRKAIYFMSEGKYGRTKTRILLLNLYKSMDRIVTLMALIEIAFVLLKQFDKICDEDNDLHHSYKRNEIILFFMELQTLFNLYEIKPTGADPIRENINDLYIRIQKILIYRYTPEELNPNTLSED